MTRIYRLVIRKAATCDTLLSEEEYSAKRSDAQTGEIDIAADGKVASRFVSNLQSQMQLFAADSGWTAVKLVNWLDCSIPHVDIFMEETGIFLTRLVLNLVETRNLSLEQLVQDKYRLKKAVEKKINVNIFIQKPIAEGIYLKNTTILRLAIWTIILAPDFYGQVLS